MGLTLYNLTLMVSTLGRGRGRLLLDLDILQFDLNPLLFNTILQCNLEPFHFDFDLTSYNVTFTELR